MVIRGIHPIFVIHTRVGKNGRLFGLLNFNLADREYFISKLLYRSQFYKFPELVNVLLGFMSVIGPRPEDPELVEDLKSKIKFYNRRFQILPGFTGWAQVRYRYDDSLKRKREQFKQDLFYLENMSLSLDFRIILRSIFILILGRKKLIQ
jgi:lipopolysaccharide/colanic/teichoic acid biosynthesis glycosyltransferase